MSIPEIPFSTALFTAMVLALIALILLLAYLADEVIRLRNDHSLDVEADHEDCAIALSAHVGDLVFAERLRTLAERYDSDAGIREVAAIRREIERKRMNTGPSIPALWLQLQADQINPPLSDADAFLIKLGEL